MKQKDLKKYSNEELRMIVTSIHENRIEELPDELQTYINAEREVGNAWTRTMRLNTLIEKEVFKRFMCNELIETNTISWLERRIATIQASYDVYDKIYKYGNEEEKEAMATLMLGHSSKLKGYKEVLNYMQSHNIE